MGSLASKIKENQDKLAIKLRTGKKAKHRCKKCGRFTVYAFDKKDLDRGVVRGKCVWCGK